MMQYVLRTGYVKYAGRVGGVGKIKYCLLEKFSNGLGRIAYITVVDK